jgi:hypothetical protein
MNRKKESARIGRRLRKQSKLTLPQSVKIAKWLIRCDFTEPPAPVVTEYRALCCDGCCWGDVHLLPTKAGLLVKVSELAYE